MGGWRKILLPLLAVVLGGVFGLGCGGGGAATGDAATPLTKAQFAKRANEICEARIKEKEDLVGKALKRYTISRTTSGNAPPHAGQELVQAILAPFEGVAEELGELPVSGKNKVAVEEIVAQFEKGFAKARGNPRAFVVGRPFEGAGAAASSYGLKGCTF